jgi:hypothetical protein
MKLKAEVGLRRTSLARKSHERTGARISGLWQNRALMEKREIRQLNKLVSITVQSVSRPKASILRFLLEAGRGFAF